MSYIKPPLHKYGLISFLIVFFPFQLLSTGTVYLVLGSDTAIWDNMSVSRHACTYNQALYTDPTGNAYGVMDPEFRQQLTDSYGQPLKMTWWMMAGNIFRYATNTNVPIPNIMPLYLMQHYHGNELQINGDEVSLHYHTFIWSDYDQDGVYYWNQAHSFSECREDFDFTLAQYLLEEQVFPVSFRSGWHYMDNGWQHYLDELLPYSMHNDWPVHHIDTEEPLDNNYDWSQAPATFIPYHPATDNYQIPGDSPGWNLRSAHLESVASLGLMDTLFAHASTGENQVACFWAHLPEYNFLANVELMNTLAHAAAETYPGVNFRYCTAVEAMQLWRGTQDTTGPVVSIQAMGSGSGQYYRISTDEPLFQPHPFVAVKYLDESYHVLSCTSVSENVWETESLPNADELAKLGVAATDTAGNLTMEYLSPKPDDIYLDNLDPQYAELSGNWSNNTEAAWGTDSRVAAVDGSHPAQAVWTLPISASTNYHVFFQIPEINLPFCPMTWVISTGSTTDTITFNEPPTAHTWTYLSTPYFEAGNTATLKLFSRLPDSLTTALLPADVVKLSAMVRDRDLHVSLPSVDFGAISLNQTTERELTVENHGLQPLTIQSIQSINGHVELTDTPPLIIPGMEAHILTLSLNPASLGPLADTLIIISDDNMHPEIRVTITANVQQPFYIVDNDDTLSYSETGDWYTSVAQAWGNSSRYAWIGSGATARFSFDPDIAGIYDVSEIVPHTINSTDYALYILKIAGVAVDSIYVNQNPGSGSWIPLGRYYLPAAATTALEVHDIAGSTQGDVIRADAIRFQLIQGLNLDDALPATLPDLLVAQNYPNPFNPVTVIRYYVPATTDILLTIYDLRGRPVLEKRQTQQPAGWESFQWQGRDTQGNPVDTGVYFCRVMTGSGISKTIKMLLLK